MTALLTAHSLSKAFGAHVLFKNLSFTISIGDKIGMIGPNGAGKSSLIKILAGLEEPDSGELSSRQNLRVGYASQAPEFPSQNLEEFLAPNGDIETLTKARILLGKADFIDFTQDASTLSGGWKKRLDIVRALMEEPDLLLLDEPTNHLDLEGIIWLENFLKRLTTPFLVISHDRYFLENSINRVIEINKCYPAGMFECKGNMSLFMQRKEEFTHAQEKKARELSHKVREEVSWLRTSPKARTGKSRSRIQQAYRLMDELTDVKQRKKVDSIGIDFAASERETRKLLVASNISKSFEDKTLFKHVDITLSPGTRLGIVGKNGTGKTTLLRLLSGEFKQDMGTLKYADDLKIVYFDQHRESIPLDITLKEALSPHGDTVNYRGQSIHVNGWAKRFLFSPERLNLPVKYLSGGERARILIAKLMLQPADVLFLDEPTNDLDIQTLEVIEESLLSFTGAVVLISHDRCLMDRVCTTILGLQENEHQFLASYEQWERLAQPISKKEKKEKSQKKQVKKLSYKEKLELGGMEEKILQQEALIEELHAAPEDTLEYYNRLGDEQAKLDQLYARWQELSIE